MEANELTAPCIDFQYQSLYIKTLSVYKRISENDRIISDIHKLAQEMAELTAKIKSLMAI